MPELYPDTEISTTNLSGTVTDLQNNDTTNWYTSPDPGANNSGVWGMQNPSANLDSQLQTVRIYLRRTGNGTDPVDFTVEVQENGTVITTLVSSSVSSTSGTEFSGTFDPANVTNPDDLEISFSSTDTGGMPGTRDVAEVGYITWDATYNVFVNATTQQPTGVGTNSATLEGEVDWQGTSLDVYFEWRQTGASTYNQTTTQTFSTTGTIQVSETISNLTEATEYEYRIFADRDNGAETSTGSLVSFWTLLAISGNATFNGSAVEGATIKILRSDTDTQVDEVLTDANGDYSVTVPGDGVYHVLGRYSDVDGEYDEFSKPFINQ